MKDADGEMLGGGIADFDTASGEMSLEWIQVLPAFRRLGYGKRIVDELLRRGREIAAFATVCGKSENRAAERLYRGCGFTGGGRRVVCDSQNLASALIGRFPSFPIRFVNKR